MRPRLIPALVLATLLSLFATPAAFADTSPAVGWTLKDWIFMGPPQFSEPQIEFDYTNGASEPFTLPIYHEAGTPGGSARSQWFAAYSKLDKTWGGVDNPAALLWYAKNVNATWMGEEMLPQGVKYTTHLTQQMAAEHFSPSMVGGANPPASGGGTPNPTHKIVSITVNASPVNYYVHGGLATPSGGMFDNQGVVTVSDSFVYDQTTYVPIRFAAELLGQPVAWNSVQYGVDLTQNSSVTPPPASRTNLRAPARADTMQITVDETPLNFYVGGSNKTPAGGRFDNQGKVQVPDGFIYDQTTYVPIRFAAELLGQPIAWNAKLYAVVVGSPPSGATRSGGESSTIAATSGDSRALKQSTATVNPQQPVEPQAVLQGTPPTVYVKRTHSGEVALGKVPKAKPALPVDAYAVGGVILVALGVTGAFLLRKRQASY